MSTLTIKNFGPIKNFHAPIARLNVLIGPQASGKSTVAKLLYLLPKPNCYNYLVLY
ncbi:AAA family ATPase [uncultured Desulfovibrio sp.]|uniref:AAA family ATPase n=1 Tax=uncultured Desulfovibrio sp. TaxID=167968 RepID=UPI00351CBBF4